MKKVLNIFRKKANFLYFHKKIYYNVHTYSGRMFLRIFYKGGSMNQINKKNNESAVSEPESKNRIRAFFSNKRNARIVLGAAACVVLVCVLAGVAFAPDSTGGIQQASAYAGEGGAPASEVAAETEPLTPITNVDGANHSSFVKVIEVDDPIDEEHAEELETRVERVDEPYYIEIEPEINPDGSVSEKRFIARDTLQNLGAAKDSTPQQIEAALLLFGQQGELTLGAEGEFVSVVQEKLAEYNYLPQNLYSIFYDEAIEESVGYFQRQNSLDVTGVVDKETLAALLDSEAEPYNITLGVEGTDVEQLQTRLYEMGYDSEATGVFDTRTMNAVEKFRDVNELESSDLIARDFLDYMYSTEAKNINGYKVSAMTAWDTPAVEALISAAQLQMGKTYVLGGKGPDVFDCSGLVYYCLNQSGYKIGYMTSGQWAVSGYTTIGSMSELQRGDIVCFAGHVGIYIGDDTMIDASSSQGQVRTAYNISQSGYWTSNFICGKRMLPQQSIAAP
jgi:cell wall-associated NlpC family hydrolase